MGKGSLGIMTVVLGVFAITAFACSSYCEAGEPVEYLPDSAVGPPLVTHLWYAMRRVEATARQPIVGKILEELLFVTGNQLAALEYDRTHAQNRMFLHAQAMWHRHWRDSAMAALAESKSESVIATAAPTYWTEGGAPLADAGMPEQPQEGDSLAADEVERTVEAAEMPEWNPWDPVNEESKRPLLHQWETEPGDEPEAEFEDEGEYEDEPLPEEQDPVDETESAEADEQAEPADDEEEEFYMQPWDPEDGAEDLPATRPVEPGAGALRDAIPELPTRLRRGFQEVLC